MTEQVVADIEKALADGASIKSAAVAAGISERTYHYWCEQAALEGAGEPLVQFLQRTTRAREQGRVALVAAIRTAAADDWRAAAWMLERMEPEAWAAKQKLEHSGPDGAPIRTEDTGAIDPSKLNRQQRAALREILDAQGG